MTAMPFESPNYTQVPNDLLGHISDEIAPGMMADMGMAELKVMLAISRLTFGFHRIKAYGSLTALCKMTGLSRQGVLDGAENAEKRGILKRHTRAGRSTVWEVVLTGDAATSQASRPVEPTSQASRPPLVKPVDRTSQASRPKKERKKEKEIKEEGASAPPPSLDPSALTVKEIKALDLDEAGWTGLLEQESAGKNRSGVKRHVKALLNKPPAAVLVYQDIAERFPKKALWPGIDKAVGCRDADLDRWASVVKNYIACGWNETNLSGMLDYFQRREIPKTNGWKNGHRAGTSAVNGTQKTTSADGGQQGTSSGAGTGGEILPGVTAEMAARAAERWHNAGQEQAASPA
jgi:hypothetical protein